MTFRITWTRTALKLPGEVRAELARRLSALSKYFPETKKRMTIGITRAYDGSVFQDDDGTVKLMLEVRKGRGGWRLPTDWTMAHELMHLAQFNSRTIPGGERACDVHALARVPPRFIDDSPSYLVVPSGLRRRWSPEAAELAHRLAREALERRAAGLRRYVMWWESEFDRRWQKERGK